MLVEDNGNLVQPTSSIAAWNFHGRRVLGMSTNVRLYA